MTCRVFIVNIRCHGNPTRRKNAGLVVGTIEGRDIEALVAKSSSSCERGCSVAVISAVPVMNEKDQAE